MYILAEALKNLISVFAASILVIKKQVSFEKFNYRLKPGQQAKSFYYKSNTV